MSNVPCPMSKALRVSATCENVSAKGYGEFFTSEGAILERKTLDIGPWTLDFIGYNAHSAIISWTYSIKSS